MIKKAGSLVILFSFISSLYAVNWDANWQNNAGTEWEQGSRWQEAVAPAPGANVWIDASAAYSPKVMGASNTSLGFLQLNSGSLTLYGYGLTCTGNLTAIGNLVVWPGNSGVPTLRVGGNLILGAGSSLGTSLVSLTGNAISINSDANLYQLQVGGNATNTGTKLTVSDSLSISTGVTLDLRTGASSSGNLSNAGNLRIMGGNQIVTFSDMDNGTSSIVNYYNPVGGTIQLLSDTKKTMNFNDLKVSDGQFTTGGNIRVNGSLLFANGGTLLIDNDVVGIANALALRDGTLRVLGGNANLNGLSASVYAGGNLWLGGGTAGANLLGLVNLSGLYCTQTSLVNVTDYALLQSAGNLVIDSGVMYMSGNGIVNPANVFLAGGNIEIQNYSRLQINAGDLFLSGSGNLRAGDSAIATIGGNLLAVGPNHSVSLTGSSNLTVRGLGGVSATGGGSWGMSGSAVLSVTAGNVIWSGVSLDGGGSSLVSVPAGSLSIIGGSASLGGANSAMLVAANVSVTSSWTASGNHTLIKTGVGGLYVDSIAKKIRNLRLDSGSNTTLANDLTVAGNTAVRQGASLNLNGNTLYQEGDWSIESGGNVGQMSTGTLVFSGAGNQLAGDRNARDNNLGAVRVNAGANVRLMDTLTMTTLDLRGIMSTNGYNLAVTGVLANDGTLRISGPEVLSFGTMDTDSGNVAFSGTGVYPIGIYTPQSYYNLEICGNATLGANITVANNLQLTGANLDLAGYNITVSGNWYGVNHSMTGSGCVVFNGSGNSSINGNNNFPNLYCTTPGKNLVFQAGSTQSVTGRLVIQGSSSANVGMWSSTWGSNFLMQYGGDQGMRYVDFYNIAFGGNQFVEFASLSNASNVTTKFISFTNPKAYEMIFGSVDIAWAPRGHWAAAGNTFDLAWRDAGTGTVTSVSTNVSPSSGNLLWTIPAAIDGSSGYLYAVSCSTPCGPLYAYSGNMTWDSVWRGGGSTSWTDGTSWQGGGAPAPAVNTLVATGSGNNPAVSTSANTSLGNLRVQTGTLTLSNQGLTVAGSMFVTGNLVATGTPTVSVGGNLDLRGGTLQVDRTTFSFNGIGRHVLYGNDQSIYKIEVQNPASLVLGGNLTQYGGGNTSLQAGANLDLNGYALHLSSTLAVSSANATVGSGYLDGSTSHDLLVSGGGNLSVGAGGNIAARHLTVDSSSFLSGRGVFGATVAGSLNLGANAVLGSSVVRMTGAAADISCAGNLHGLRISGNVTNQASALSVSDNLYVDPGATLDLVAGRSSSGNLSNSGNLRLQGTSQVLFSAMASGPNSAVDYYGALGGNVRLLAGATQTMSFFDLKLQDGSFTAGGNMSVAGNLLFANGSKLLVDDDTVGLGRQLDIRGGSLLVGNGNVHLNGNAINVHATGNLSLASTVANRAVLGAAGVSSLGGLVDVTGLSELFTGGNLVVAGGTVSVSGNGLVHPGNAFVSTGNLQLRESSRLLTDSGNLVVAGGNIQMSGNAIAAVGGTVQASGTTYAVNLSESANLLAANGVAVAGGGVWALSGSANLLVQRGGIAVTNSGAWGLSGNAAIRIQAGDLGVAAGGPWTLSDNAALRLSAGNLSLAGGSAALSGNTAIVVSAGNMSVLSPGSISYAGESTTTLDKGLLVTGGWSAGGNATLVKSGTGTLYLDQASKKLRNLRLDSGSNTMLASVVGVAGNTVVKSGAVLGMNGNTMIQEGDFTIESGGRFDKGATTVAGNTSYSGNLVLNGNLRIADQNLLNGIQDLGWMRVASGANVTLGDHVKATTVDLDGILTTAGNDLFVSGVFRNNGTLRVKGTETVSIGTMDTDSGNVVLYGGSGALGSINPASYYNLSLYGPGAYAIASGVARLDVYGALVLGAGSNLDTAGSTLKCFGDAVIANGAGFTNTTGTLVFASGNLATIADNRAPAASLGRVQVEGGAAVASNLIVDRLTFTSMGNLNIGTRTLAVRTDYYSNTASSLGVFGSGTVSFDNSGNTVTAAMGGSQILSNATVTAGTNLVLANDFAVRDYLTVNGRLYSAGYNVSAGNMLLGSQGLLDLIGGERAAVTVMDTDSGTVQFSGTVGYGLAGGGNLAVFPTLRLDGGAFTMQRDVAVNQSLILNRGSLDLNGYRLTITGNMTDLILSANGASANLILGSGNHVISAGNILVGSGNLYAPATALTIAAGGNLIVVNGALNTASLVLASGSNFTSGGNSRIHPAGNLHVLAGVPWNPATSLVEMSGTGNLSVWSGNLYGLQENPDGRTTLAGNLAVLDYTTVYGHLDLASYKLSGSKDLLVARGGNLALAGGNADFSRGEIALDQGRLLLSAGNVLTRNLTLRSGGYISDAAGQITVTGNIGLSGNSVFWAGGNARFSELRLADNSWFNSGNTMRLSGNIHADTASTVRQTGGAVSAGNLILAGGAYYLVTGGSSCSLLLAGNVTVGANATFSVGSGNAVVRNGGVSVTSGNLLLGSGALSTAGGDIQVSAGTLLLATGRIESGNLVMTNGAQADSTGAAAIVLAGNLDITGARTMFDAGGASVSARRTTVDAGTLRQGDGRLALGDLVLANGGNFLNDGTGLGSLALTGNLVVGSGSVFNLGSASMARRGSLTNNGTIVLTGNYGVTSAVGAAGAGSVKFTPTSASAMIGATYGGNDFFNLEIAGGNIVLANSINVTNNLVLTSGNLDLSGYDLTVSGNWSNAGVRLSGAGRVVFNGSGNASIGGNNTFPNLYCTNSNTVLVFAAGSNQTVSGNLAFQGNPSANVQVRSSSSGNTFTLRYAGDHRSRYVDFRSVSFTGNQFVEYASDDRPYSSNVSTYFMTFTSPAPNATIVGSTSVSWSTRGVWQESTFDLHWRTSAGKVLSVSTGNTVSVSGNSMTWDSLSLGVQDGDTGHLFATSKSVLRSTDHGPFTIFTRAKIDSASLDYGTGTLTVVFNDALSSSVVDLSKIWISNTPGAKSVSLSGASTPVVSGRSFTTTMTVAQRAASLAISGVSGGDGSAALLDLAAGAVYTQFYKESKEILGAVIAETADATAPTLGSWSLNLVAGTMTLGFNEAVKASSLNVTRVTLADAAGASHTLTGAAAVTQDGITGVIVQLTPGDLAALTAKFGASPSALSAQAQAGAIQDNAGVPITAVQAPSNSVLAMNASGIAGALSASTATAEATRVMDNVYSTLGVDGLLANLGSFAQTAGGGTRTFQSSALPELKVVTATIASTTTVVSSTTPGFAFSLRGLPAGTTLTICTIPLAKVAGLPAGATGAVLAFDLRSGATQVSSGFTAPLTFQDIYRSGKFYNLHWRNGKTFENSGFVQTMSSPPKDLTFMVTHFSEYVLGITDIPSSSSSGPGGGCLLEEVDTTIGQ